MEETCLKINICMYIKDSMFKKLHSFQWGNFPHLSFIFIENPNSFMPQSHINTMKMQEISTKNFCMCSWCAHIHACLHVEYMQVPCIWKTMFLLFLNYKYVFLSVNMYIPMSTSTPSETKIRSLWSWNYI